MKLKKLTFLCHVLLWAANLMFAVEVSAAPNHYSADLQFDLRRVPFSCYGSFLSFQELGSDGKAGSLEGLFLRTVHGNVPQHELLQLKLIQRNQEVPFQIVASPTLLTLKSSAGQAEIVFATPNRVRIRLHNVSLRLDRPGGAAASDNSFATWAEPVDQAGGLARTWDYTASPQDLSLRITSARGALSVENTWNGEASDKVSFTFSPDSEGYADAVVEEFVGTFHGDSEINDLPDYMNRAKRARSSDGDQGSTNGAATTFDEDLANLRRKYGEWLSTMPAVPDDLQDAADLAAYVDWSSVVAARGFLTRPTMLMSKVTMTDVWSWDHCFNAMALASSQPELAWSQFMWVFDSENSDGISPDLLTDRWLLWSFSKPPIHGLTMAYLEQANPAFFSNPVRLKELYPKLVRRTEWYFKYRDWDQDGLPQYNHGNDSGWDNSTVFSTLPPAETPDLAAFLVLQMEELGKIASELKKTDESHAWMRRAKELRQKLLRAFWQDSRFVALHDKDHRVIDSDSLILYLPIVLGRSLPQQVRQQVIRKLKEPGYFLSSHGLSTEPLSSPNYVEDGYWRGPIWAPSTFLIVEGADAAGDHEFANDLRKRFCELVRTSGFAENFGAKSGVALRDPSYTWTASVFLIFAHELESKTRGEFGGMSSGR